MEKCITAIENVFIFFSIFSEWKGVQGWPFGSLAAAETRNPPAWGERFRGLFLSLVCFIRICDKVFQKALSVMLKNFIFEIVMY